MENCNKDSSLESGDSFKSKKTSKVSYLVLKVSVFVKIFEFYLMTQSLFLVLCISRLIYGQHEEI